MILRIKAVLLALGLGFMIGCDPGGSAAADPTPEPAPLDKPDPVERVPDPGPADPGPTPRAIDRVDANLARIDALEVVRIDGLAGPASATRAQRLEELADVAEAAVLLPAAAEACQEPAIDANLAALQALDIVAVTGLVVAEPANNPFCYNLPCAEDIAAAEALTCERAGQLANLTDAALGHFDAERPPATDGTLAAIEAAPQNLARLEALEVFEVGALIAPESEGEAALRLAALADTAEAALDDWVAAGACADEAVAANLAALRALEIVEVGGLLVVAPENNPHCYNFPCPEDEAAAAEATCERADDLARIAAASEGL